MSMGAAFLAAGKHILMEKPMTVSYCCWWRWR